MGWDRELDTDRGREMIASVSRQCYTDGVRKEKQRVRNVGLLVVLGVFALGYAGTLWLRHRLVGGAMLDGGIGVVLGLYICSRPVANLLDILLFETHWRASARRTDVAWVALNLLVLAFGCIVVMVGTTRFATATR
jgi:hypothetical protein